MNSKQMELSVGNFMENHNLKGANPQTFEEITTISHSDLWNFTCNIITAYCDEEYYKAIIKES